MTTTIERKTIRENIIATITVNKEGECKLLIYHDNKTDLINNSDIIANKAYVSERSARSAMARYIKKIKEGRI